VTFEWVRNARWAGTAAIAAVLSAVSAVPTVGTGAPLTPATPAIGAVPAAKPLPRPADQRQKAVPIAQAMMLMAQTAPAATPTPPKPPPPPPLPFETRARPTIDLSTIVLRPSDEALILKTLEDAPSHGFRRNEFSEAGLAEALAASDPDVRAGAVRALKVALIRYARAQHGQRIAPDSFKKNWGVHPDPYNPDKGFAAAVAEDRLAAWIDDLPPRYQGYISLRVALKTYRDIAVHGGWETIPTGTSALALNATGARVLALRARLAAEDPTLPAAAAPEIFDAELVEVIKRYQLRSGLNPTGVVDSFTLTALNQPVGQRIMQIIANLERWRWIDRDMPPTRIEVNIAAAGMTVYNNNYPGLSMRAVAGRPSDQSPMLQSRIDAIVVNPPWNVPYAIARKEYWPKERKHPGYLEAHGFRAIPDGTNGGVRLQQMAGPSALGKLKFDFPNPYGVYLHDTPTHSTFATDSRAQSHGCIRLQNPAALAQLLTANMPEWTPEILQEAIDSGDTKRIHLATPIDVVILYWTAYVGKGQVSFRQDIYGWDRDLLQLLEPQPAKVPDRSPESPAA
jgi:murein L,D-transpeptidase YcbB/YkuD